MSWTEKAACADAVTADPSLQPIWDNIDYGDWDTSDYGPHAMEGVAKEICASCPVRQMCLMTAIEDPEAEGIRAGYRFTLGKVSHRDSTRIKRDWGVKAKVARKRVEVSVEDTEMQELRTND